MANTNTDQIRRLTNRFALAGPIAEIVDFTEGKTKETNIPYISFIGTIRCGETPVYDQRFKIFSTAKKKDLATGEYVDRPNYEKLRDWCKSCVPMTKDTEHCTWVELGGYIGMNDYVNRENKLVESIQFNVNWTRTFEDYKAEINLEAMIHNIIPEVRGEEEVPTGRVKIRMVSTDQFGNAVDMKICKADEEIAQQLEDAGYGKGALATYFLSLIPSTPTENKPKSGGIGQQRTTTGKSFLEYMLVGADPIIDEDDEKLYIQPKTIQRLMAERKNHLKEIEAKGYQGSNGASNSSKPSSGGIGKTNSSAKNTSDEDVDDEDMPF